MDRDSIIRTERVVDGVALVDVRTPLVGSRPTPLVMVHGGCHGAWCWATLQTWFAERGWNSVAVDWLSHGRSTRLDPREWLRRGIPEVRHEIEIACAAATEDGGGAPVVVGHSMGGLATLAYAATTTRELAAIALLTPVVPRQFGGAAVELDIDPDQPWGPPPPDVARQLFYAGLDDAAAAACYARLQPESPAAVWQATRWTAEVDVSAVRVPALVVAAEDDRLVPADYVLALAAAMGAEQIRLPGVGHGVTLDPGWPQLCLRIESWLSSVTGQPRTGAAQAS